MDLTERYNHPGTYVAANFSRLERNTLQSAYTEAVNLDAADIVENAEEGEDVDFASIPDKAIELSLLEAEDSVTLTVEEIDNVRSTLIGFARGTVETIRAKLKETDRHDLYDADSIPNLMRMGRCALKMQDEFASKNTSKGAVDPEHRVKDTEDVEKFLASIQQLTAPGDTSK